MVKEQIHFQENTQNIYSAQYPLHHVTYPTTKFALSSGLGEDSFTNIYILKVIL